MPSQVEEKTKKVDSDCIQIVMIAYNDKKEPAQDQMIGERAYFMNEGKKWREKRSLTYKCDVCGRTGMPKIFTLYVGNYEKRMPLSVEMRIDLSEFKGYHKWKDEGEDLSKKPRLSEAGNIAYLKTIWFRHMDFALEWISDVLFYGDKQFDAKPGANNKAACKVRIVGHGTLAGEYL